MDNDTGTDDQPSTLAMGGASRQGVRQSPQLLGFEHSFPDQQRGTPNTRISSGCQGWQSSSGHGRTKSGRCSRAHPPDQSSRDKTDEQSFMPDRSRPPHDHKTKNRNGTPHLRQRSRSMDEAAEQPTTGELLEVLELVQAGTALLGQSEATTGKSHGRRGRGTLPHPHHS